jgi:hypothetical protein
MMAAGLAGDHPIRPCSVCFTRERFAMYAHHPRQVNVEISAETGGPSMKLQGDKTAIVLIESQNDFLSPGG